MELKLIKTEEEYHSCLDWVESQFDQQVSPLSAEGEKVQIVLLLIKQFEDAHYQVPLPDPLEAIKIKMKEKGLRNKDLVGRIGSKGYVSSIMNGKKPLTLPLIRILHRELGIPAEVLLA